MIKFRHILLWLPVIAITIVSGLYHWLGVKTLLMLKLNGLTVYVSVFMWLWLLVHMIGRSQHERIIDDVPFIIQCKTILGILLGNKIIPHIGSVLIVITGNEHLPDAYKQSWVTAFIVILAIAYLIVRHYKHCKRTKWRK